MPESFDPYRKWLGIPPADQPPHHYRLLGIPVFEDDLDVIAYAADRQMTHVRKFQSGQYSQHSQKLLNELAQARLCLLNAKEKAAYDEQLRAKLGVAASAGGAAVSVAAPRPSTKPVPSQPRAAPTPPPTAPPQPAPPQSAPPVATMEPPPAPVPLAKATAPKSSVAVRTGPMAATARRSRNRSQGPIVVALCVIAGLGLLAVVLAVALNNEIGDSDSDADSGPFVASPPIGVHPQPDPPKKRDKPPKAPRPKPPKPVDPMPITRPDETDDDNSDSDADNDAPPPNLDDPDRTAKIEEALTAAEKALAGRDVAEALAQINIARPLQYSGGEKQQVADLEELHGLHEQFWNAVDRGIKRLKNGDEIGFQSNISNFVSADEENITLLITGNRMTTKRRELEVPYLIALAERGLSRSDPPSRLVIAAFLAVDNRDPSAEHLDYARKMLAEAVGGGATSEALSRRLTPQEAAPSLPKPGDDPQPE